MKDRSIIPETPVKKPFKQFVLEHLMEQQKQINEIQRTIQELVEKEVATSLGDKIHLMNSTLTDIMVQRRIFIDKGFITREDIKDEYERLKQEK